MPAHRVMCNERIKIAETQMVIRVQGLALALAMRACHSSRVIHSSSSNIVYIVFSSQDPFLPQAACPIIIIMTP